MKPTEKQIALLHKLDLWIPHTKAVACRLINYILHGNGTGTNKRVRVGYATYFCNKWFNKTVQCKYSGRIGVVGSIMPRSKREIDDDIPKYVPVPFLIAVRWCGDHRLSSYTKHLFVNLLPETLERSASAPAFSGYLALWALEPTVTTSQIDKALHKMSQNARADLRKSFKQPSLNKLTETLGVGADSNDIIQKVKQRLFR